MPCANLPMTFAVAGATSSRAMSDAIEMCSMSALAPGAHCSGDHAAPGNGLEGDFTDEPARRSRHHGLDVVSALLQQARDLHGLVGADAAGHAEGDESHGYPKLLMMPAAAGFIRRNRARSASTIDRSRPTADSTSSFTTT